MVAPARSCFGRWDCLPPCRACRGQCDQESPRGGPVSGGGLRPFPNVTTGQKPCAISVGSNAKDAISPVGRVSALQRSMPRPGIAWRSRQMRVFIRSCGAPNALASAEISCADAGTGSPSSSRSVAKIAIASRRTRMLRMASMASKELADSGAGRPKKMSPPPLRRPRPAPPGRPAAAPRP